MAYILNDDTFAPVADRWLPLIYKGAIEYQVPGKLDAEDLVQEGLKLLYEEIQKRVVDMALWEVDSNDFEKYFKSAFFHRLVDLKRSLSTKKRDHTREVRATEDYDPLESLVVASHDDAESELVSEAVYQQVMDRLSESHQRVLECLVHPPEELLSTVREHSCPQCLYLGSPSSDGKCPMCLENGFDYREVLQPTKTPSRVHQSEIQDHLMMKRMAVSEAIFTIRQTLKAVGTVPDRISLKSFMEVFGYGNIVDDDGVVSFRPWPMASSCRYEEGTPSSQHLTYYSLRDILNPDEVVILDFMVSHTTEYYTSIRFTDLARRTNRTVHQIREAADSIRVKLELVESGVPLRDIPKYI